MAEFICPHCKQSIFDDDALLCHFCGESLGRASSGALGQVKGSHRRKWFLIALIVLVMGSFLLLMMR